MRRARAYAGGKTSPKAGDPLALSEVYRFATEPEPTFQTIAALGEVGAPIQIAKHGKQTVVRLNKKKRTPVIAQPRELPALHWVATCKWIDGDPMAGEYTVCGQPAAIKPNGDAKPYCPHHCSIAYLKPRERAAERQPEQVG
jgi:hypothetical protein